MLKKLLTLSLVAVMLSTVALASDGLVGFGVPTYAEEAEPITETFAFEATDILKISYTGTGEAETQTAATVSGYSVLKTAANENGIHTIWLLFRKNVGKNWLMDESTTLALSTYMKRNADTTTGTAYYIPSTKAAWEDAADGTLDTLLPHPKDVEGHHTKTSKNSKNQYYTASFSGNEFSGSYDGEYVYFAMEVVAETEQIETLKSHWGENWYVKITGTKEAPAVTDFSEAVIAWDNGTCTISNVPATGTAMLIAASFSGSTMVDAQVATIDAATDVENGVITENFAGLQAGSSVKVFLWNPTTLEPAITPATF